MSFTHARPGRGTEVLLTSSEAEFEIDYWVDGKSLHVVQYTFQIDAHPLVPLLEHRFTVGNFPAQRSLSVMLEPPPRAVERFPDAISALRGPPVGKESDLYKHLYSIRDFGLLDPVRAVKELDGLRGAWWYDGAAAEQATALRSELELVSKALGKEVA